jgi:hypothetical protein
VLSYEQEGAALSDPSPQVLSLGSRRGKKGKGVKTTYLTLK